MAALETALILGGIKAVGGLFGSSARREAAKRKAEIARKQLEQERLFKKMQLKHGWMLNPQQSQALQQAPTLPMPGPTRTGSTMDALGQLAGDVASGYETYLDLKDDEDDELDLYKKLQKKYGE